MVEYEQYLRSPEWQEQRKEALERAHHRCQLCSRTPTGTNVSLHVHHNTYQRLGHEIPSDLIVLCECCHYLFHYYRRPRTKEWTPNHEAAESAESWSRSNAAAASFWQLAVYGNMKPPKGDSLDGFDSMEEALLQGGHHLGWIRFCGSNEWLS